MTKAKTQSFKDSAGITFSSHLMNIKLDTFQYYTHAEHVIFISSRRDEARNKQLKPQLKNCVQHDNETQITDVQIRVSFNL